MKNKFHVKIIIKLVLFWKTIIFCGRLTPFTVLYIRVLWLVHIMIYLLAVDCEWRYHSFMSCFFFLKMTEQYKVCCSSTVSVQDSSGSSLVSYVLLWRQQLLWKACSTIKVPMQCHSHEINLLCCLLWCQLLENTSIQ